MPTLHTPLPEWAQQMRDLFKSGSTSQFIVYGNIFDVVPSPSGAGISEAGGGPMTRQDSPGDGSTMLPIKQFLDQVMFSSYDTILHYDRGKGIRATRGADDFSAWLHDTYGTDALRFAQMRDTGPALELIDRYLLRSLNLQQLTEGKSKAPRRIAVVIEFAEFVVPRGNPLHLGGEFSSNVVKALGWANDPAILGSNIATVLLTEGLHDLNELIVENPRAAKLEVPLPDETQMQAFVQWLIANEMPQLATKSEVEPDVLGGRLTGLSCVGAQTALGLAMQAEGEITIKWLSRMKKQLIERECAGLLEFMESTFTLDHVAGHGAVKDWLREDTQLLRGNKLHALPMGYLIAGRIGTGKTFIVRCWAGELGIPCVVFKNFRDRWVGATESNLEKIFGILRALGQVVVFVDEADQMTGKREGGDNDSGLSGRVYAMLAKEMSDTSNRGKIIWVFATSRPDLLEVDLKRQGRLDVHIPLFAPQTPQEVKALFMALAGKLKFPLDEQDIPPLPEGLVLGGNEIEGVLVRALRVHALQKDAEATLKDILKQVMEEIRPSAHARKLEYMDMIAVKECTDSRFLPEQYKAMSSDQVDQRISELRSFI